MAYHNYKFNRLRAANDTIRIYLVDDDGNRIINKGKVRAALSKWSKRNDVKTFCACVANIYLEIVLLEGVPTRAMRRGRGPEGRFSEINKLLPGQHLAFESVRRPVGESQYPDGLKAAVRRETRKGKIFRFSMIQYGKFTLHRYK